MPLQPLNINTLPKTNGIPTINAGGGSFVGLGGYGSSLQNSMDAANRANEQRYQQILALWNQQIGNTDTYGQTQHGQIDRNTAARIGSMNASAIDRGIYNTTVPDSLRRGIQSDADFQGRAVDESVQQQRNALLQGKAGAIERRTDLGPDLGMFSRLYQSAGGGSRSFTGGSNAAARGGIFGPQYQADRQQISDYEDNYNDYTTQQGLRRDARRMYQNNDPTYSMR